MWFASGDINEKEWILDSVKSVTGTVKNLLDNCRFGKQTILTRVKIIK